MPEILLMGNPPSNKEYLRVTPVAIHSDRSEMPYITFDEPELLDRFAQQNGFDNWVELLQWVDEIYGLPFEGVFVEW